MILQIYLTGLLVTFFFDMSIDLTIKDNNFNAKWVSGMIFSFLFWPFVVPANLIMVLYLRSKGKYTFRRDDHKNSQS